MGKTFKLIITAVFLFSFSARVWAQADSSFTIDSYIKLYLNNSTALASEYNNLAIAQANYKNKFMSLFLPSAGFSAGTELFSKDNPNFRFNNPYDSSLYVDWNIFNSGRDYLTFAQQKNILEIARRRFDNKLQDSALDAIKIFYDLKLKESLLKVARRDLEDKKEQFEITSNLYREGLRAYSDLLLSENTFKNSQLRLAQQTADYTSSKITFNNRISRGINAPVTLDYELGPSAPLFTSTYEEDFATAIQNREDINSAILALHNSKISQKLATMNNLPTLSAGFALSNTSNDTFGNRDNRTDYALGLRLNVPIGFVWADKYNEIKISKLELINSYMGFEDMVRSIKELVSNTRTNLQLQFAGIEISENNLKIAAERLEIIRNQYKDGAASSLYLSQAQDEFLNAQINDTTYKYNYRLNQYLYKRTLGLNAHDLSAVPIDTKGFEQERIKQINRDFLRKR